MADPRPGKMTLIEMVIDILSAMDSDEVNSLGDSVEAIQVAETIRRTFYSMINNLEVPYRTNAFQLESVSDAARPNYLKLPSSVKDITSIHYDYQTESKTTWKEVCYMDPEDFIRMSLNRSTGDDVTAVTDFSGAPFYIVNNQNPTYYTSFDDEYLVFDSWDLGIETTMQEHKSLALGTTQPSFVMEDTFIPDLPASSFPLLLSESMNLAFVNLKQVSNSEEQRRARQHLIRGMNNRHRTKQDSAKGVNFGRKANH